MIRKLFLPLSILIIIGISIFFFKQSEPDASPVASPVSQKVIESVAGPEPEQPDVDESAPESIDQTGLAVKDLRRQGRYVLGTVTDPYGTPVPRARIQAMPEDGGPPHVAAGKDDGSFYVMAPAGVAHTLVIEVAGVPSLEVDAP